MDAAQRKTLIDRLPPHITGTALMPAVEKLRAGRFALSLDASAVEALSLPGLEGLLVIGAAQRARGDPFACTDPSDAFLADLALFGVSLDDFTGAAP